MKNTIYIKNPDDLKLNFIKKNEANFIILINENIENKYKYTLNLNKENTSSKILFLIITGENSKLDFNIFVNHFASKTSLDLKFKTVLFKNAHLNFNGNIFVEKNLKKIKSSMIHQNLLESKESKIISKPNLEINSDEVEINHGFATGNFNKEEIYYLQSRNLSKKTIKKELTKAFLFKELEGKISKELKKQIKQDIICSIPL
jgi:Fe-S cluster assembly protein SufD